jgi:drug/metabolite transporter (DMT)-like permease
MKRTTLLILLSYLTIYLVWGSTYFFIKLAVETIPPFLVIGLRFLVGGALILLFAGLSGRIKQIPRLKEIGAAVFLGTFLLLIGNGMVTMAERKVDSYLVALIMASTPLVVAFFDWILLRKAISWLGLSGIFLGVLGVALLLYNGHSFAGVFRPEIIMVITGLVSWGFATSLGHKMKVYPDIFVNSGLQMIYVGIVCGVGLFIFQPALFNAMPVITARSLFGIWYLALVGSGAFCAYSFLISHEPAIRVVSYSFVNPLIAVLLGMLIDHEKPVPFLMFGIPLILMGLFLMLYVETVCLYLKRKSGNVWPVRK